MKAVVIFLAILTSGGIVDSLKRNLDSIFRMTEQLLEENGYPFESHWVQTPDNYILNIHRIPRRKTYKNNNRVAFLQHGIMSLSTAWILPGHGKSLAFMLADEGYDVWMGNFRGNVFSRNHTILDPDTDTNFWQFTWDEMGLSDLPTMIDYVLKQTLVDKVYFVGHSQACTAFYVMASDKPEYNNKISVAISLAPIAFLDHLSSPILRMMSRLRRIIKLLLDLTGTGEFLPETGFIGNMAERLSKRDATIKVCENIMFSVLGYSLDQKDDKTIALMIHCHPAGTSTKEMMHFGQARKSGSFRKYDYGSYQNLKMYGTEIPPEYQLKNITTPVFVFYSDYDIIATAKDVDKLCTKLKNCSGKFLLHNFSHLDFIYGKNASGIIYKNIINIFNMYSYPSIQIESCFN